MSAKLIAYEYAPPGFEIVIDNADIEMGKIWNLWHNVTLSDNPGSWDREISLVNEMQSKLGKLSIDQRLIRAQMAEFCRVCPVFPSSIDILCEEIGTDRFSKPMKMGCEGRGLLDSLGYHDQSSLSEQQKETLAEQVRSLEKWLQKDHAETAAELKIFGFLGQPTRDKVIVVRKVIRTVSSAEPSVSSFRKLAENVCKETQKDSVTAQCERYCGRPFNCFGCLSEDISITKCQCCYSMFLDASILCAGTSGEGRSMLDEFKNFAEENILLYSVAVNSWLNGEPPAQVAWLENARYVPEDSWIATSQKIHSFLGEKNDAKEWLTACLLKTIKDNQRWHKRTELLDDFPEAISYFRELP